MSDNEILTAINDLNKKVDKLEFTVNAVVRDQNVIDEAVRRMQLDFITINEWLQKLTVGRNHPNSQT
jgi:hypothetical protein